MKLKLITLLLSVCFALPIHANFTINSNADTPDAMIGDGICADASGNCTLRAAIEESNNANTFCVINFMTGFGGTIILTSDLPAITSTANTIITGGTLGNVIIDGAMMYAAFEINGATVEFGSLVIQNTYNSIKSSAINNIGGSVTLSNSTIDAALSDRPGGAISNGSIISPSSMMTISKSTISNNSTTASGTSAGGGAIYNAGTINISETTFQGNNAADQGGAIFNAENGNVLIESSTLYENSAAETNATDPGGGAIYVSNRSTTRIVYSTISDNSTDGGGGGGIATRGLLILENSTIVNNTAGRGGSIDARNSQELQMTNTILAYSNSTAGSITDLEVTITTNFSVNDNNIVESCGSAFSCPPSSSFITLDPQLKDLADNGGCTLTHLPCPTSPAIDAGLSNANTTDQRGENLPFDAPGPSNADDATDIGSVEVREDELPVELVSFQAIKSENNILLSWRTASELNNEGFEIQRSKDTRKWQVQAFVKGYGTTLDPQEYKWLDESAISGQSYYRLKQVDFDGDFEYSPIESILWEEHKETSLNVFPNPVKEEIFFEITDNWADEHCLLQLHDTYGRLVRKWIRYDSTPLNLADLPKGVYVLSAHVGTMHFSEILVKE